jgi:hypothetical protein
MATNWKGRYSKSRELFAHLITIYRREPNIRMFLEVVLTLSTTSFFIAFALRPTLVTISGLTVDIKAKESVVATMDTKIKNISLAQANFESESKRLPLISSAIPNSPYPQILVRQLEGLAAADNVRVTGLTVNQVTLSGSDAPMAANPDEVSSTGGTKSLGFSISVTGDFTSLAKFLADTEKLRRPVKISEGSITLTIDNETKSLILAISGEVPYLDNVNGVTQ